jgi:hypothetical protein
VSWNVPRRPPVVRIRSLDGDHDLEAKLRRARAQARHKALLGWVVGQAEAHGWSALFVHDSRHSPAGKLDLSLRRPPRWIEAEIKTGGAQLSAAQLAEAALLSEYPWIEVYEWRDGDEPRILELLK